VLPIDSQYLPIRKLTFQALAKTDLSTISTIFPFASLFNDDIACPLTFIVVWMEACRTSSCCTFIGTPVSSSHERYV
jgi:hypothetical protein